MSTTASYCCICHSSFAAPGQRRPPAARFARRSSSHFLVLSCGQPGPVLAGRQEASSRLPSKPHDADGLHTRAFLLFCTFSFSSAHFISSMRTVSLHRAEPSASTAPATTLQQPLLSVLVGRLMFASASATGATRRPFALSSASFSGVAFLRSPFFFLVLLVRSFWWLLFCVVRTDTRAGLSTLCALPWGSNTAVH